MFAQAYNIIIDSVVGSPGHGRYVVDVLNATDKKINFGDNCATAWCINL